LKVYLLIVRRSGAKSLGGVYGVALQAAEKARLHPFRLPYSSQILASFGQFRKVISAKLRHCVVPCSDATYRT
jgi:hypothetical protein